MDVMAIVLAAVLAGLISLWIARHMYGTERKERDQRDDQSLADAWRTAMEELRHVLVRIYGIWTILNDGKIPNSEVFLSPAISAPFFARSPDPRATAHLIHIHQNVHNISWNMQQVQILRAAQASSPDGVARANAEKAIRRHLGSAKWFIRNRHHTMAERLRACEEIYKLFCQQMGLRQGENLAAVPTLPESEREAEGQTSS